MLGCELLFGEEKGARIRAMIEDATGAPCPCARDRACPLLGEPLKEPAVPRPRVAETLAEPLAG